MKNSCIVFVAAMSYVAVACVGCENGRMPPASAKKGNPWEDPTLSDLARIESLHNSNLAPAEKGAVLLGFLKEGMTEEEVDRVLGKNILSTTGAVGLTGRSAVYPDYRISLHTSMGS